MLIMDKLERVGIDKLVLSGIKVKTDKNIYSKPCDGGIEEKFEIKEELFSIGKVTTFFENGEMNEKTYLRFNPNKIIYGHNITNARVSELELSMEILVDILKEKGIEIDFKGAKIAGIEINKNLFIDFENFKEVLILLFVNLPNVRKIGNKNSKKSYKNLFDDSTLDGGWDSNCVRAYDKRRQVANEDLLNFDLTRIEWDLTAAAYKYYAKKINKENTIDVLLENIDILDQMFKGLCRGKLFKEAYKYLEKELEPNLEQGFLDFKKDNKLARATGRVPNRNVYKHLDENYWIFDYSNLEKIISIHDKSHKTRELKRIRKNYFHLNNKEKLSYLVEKIFNH